MKNGYDWYKSAFVNGIFADIAILLLWLIVQL